MTASATCAVSGHAGPHLLSLRHTIPNGGVGGTPHLGWPTWRYVELALECADENHDDVVEAVKMSRQVLERAKIGSPADGTVPGGKAELIELDDTEFAAFVLAVEDSCEYMSINDYASDDDFPEGAAAATALGDGQIAWWCTTGLS